MVVQHRCINIRAGRLRLRVGGGRQEMTERWRWDRFEVGDRVTWADDYYAEMTRGRERHGDGPFEVLAVETARYTSSEIPYVLQGVENASRWAAMGHTQFVTVNHVSDGNWDSRRYSGAFFRRVE